MSTPPEDFEPLQKLLKLKRYEQPPPRYFNEFSGCVVSRLQEEAAAGPQEKLWQEAPWLKRFFQFLEASPLAAGGFAAGICALLVGGIVYSEYTDRSPAELASPDGTQFSASTRLASFQPQAGLVVSSTNAILGGMGFGPLGGSLNIRQVSWHPGGQ